MQQEVITSFLRDASQHFAVPAITEGNHNNNTQTQQQEQKEEDNAV